MFLLKVNPRLGNRLSQKILLYQGRFQITLTGLFENNYIYKLLYTVLR